MAEAPVPAAGTTAGELASFLESSELESAVQLRFSVLDAARTKDAISRVLGLVVGLEGQLGNLRVELDARIVKNVTTRGPLELAPACVGMYVCDSSICR